MKARVGFALAGALSVAVVLVVGGANLRRIPTSVELEVDVSRVEFVAADETRLLQDVGFCAIEFATFDTATIVGTVSPLSEAERSMPNRATRGPRAVNANAVRTISFRAGPARMSPSIRFEPLRPRGSLGGFGGAMIPAGTRVTIEPVADEDASVRFEFKSAAPSGQPKRLRDFDLALPDTVLISYRNVAVSAPGIPPGDTTGSVLAVLSPTEHTRISPGTPAWTVVTLKLPESDSLQSLVDLGTQIGLRRLLLSRDNNRRPAGWVGSILDGTIAFPLYPARNEKRRPERIAPSDNLLLVPVEGEKRLAIHSIGLRGGNPPALHLSISGMVAEVKLGPPDNMQDRQMRVWDAWLAHPVLGPVTKILASLFMLLIGGGITVKIAIDIQTSRKHAARTAVASGSGPSSEDTPRESRKKSDDA